MEDLALSHPNCVLCGASIDVSNDTEEHIIPNAIGGRRKVTGFICKPCNDTTGNSWDAALAKEAQSLCLLLQVKRERGETPSQKLTTIGGKDILLNPDGGMHYADIKGEIVELEGQKAPEHQGAHYQGSQEASKWL